MWWRIEDLVNAFCNWIRVIWASHEKKSVLEKSAFIKPGFLLECLP